MGMIGNSLAQGLISGANIQDGSVDTVDLKAGAVTPAKLSTGAPNWDSSGNFGVNTPSPQTFVHVTGGAASAGNVTNWNMRLSTGAAGSAAYGAVGTGIYLDSWTNNNGSNPIAGIASYLIGGGTGGSATDHSGGLTFFVKSAGSASLSRAVTIDSSSRVGIGATSPSYLLDIWGFSSNAANQDVLRLYNQAGSTSSVSMVFHTGANNVTAAIRNVTTSTHAAALSFETNNGSGLAQRFRIDPNGPVLIGAGSGASFGYPFTNGTLQFGGMSIAPWSGTGMYIQTNCYYDGTSWKYMANGPASQLTLSNSGVLSLGKGASGTAGNTVSWTGSDVLTNASGTENTFNSNTTMSANTRYKIGQLPEVEGTYALYITMGGGTNSGGGRIYWACSWGAVIGAISGNIYNAGSPNPLTVSGMDHYRSVAMPTFDMDSDNGYDANYGGQCIFVTFPQTTNVESMRFFYKRLM